jgi:hypothetical protein
MLAILHLLAAFIANLFKSRRRLEVENLYLRHQLNIALRRVEGESLRRICRDAGMPRKATVFHWIARHKEFRDRYISARDFQAEGLCEEMIEIRASYPPLTCRSERRARPLLWPPSQSLALHRERLARRRVGFPFGAQQLAGPDDCSPLRR